MARTCRSSTHRRQRLLWVDERQFSPTADLGSKLKNGVVNDCLHRHLRAGHRARRDVRGAVVLGDKKQLLALMKAALSHRGTVMLDVISPCVTFNDHEGSTKSYAYAKEHDDPLEEVSFVPFFEDISVDYDPGTTQEVKMHDGSRLLLKKLMSPTTQPTSSRRARAARSIAPRRVCDRNRLHRARSRRLLRLLNVVDEPLAQLPLERTGPRRPRSTKSWSPCDRLPLSFVGVGADDVFGDGNASWKTVLIESVAFAL